MHNVAMHTQWIGVPAVAYRQALASPSLPNDVIITAGKRGERFSNEYTEVMVANPV